MVVPKYMDIQRIEKTSPSMDKITGVLDYVLLSWFLKKQFQSICKQNTYILKFSWMN